MHFRQILIALPLLAPCAIAGGFDPHLVSAEAPWILHVDLEALSHSSLLSSLHEEGLFFENEFDLDRVKTEFGLDPFVDLGSITMYGVDARGDGVATVICGTEKLAAVWSQLAIKAPPTHVAGYDITQIGKGSEARCVTLLPARDGLPRRDRETAAPSGDLVNPSRSVQPWVP